MGRTPADNIPAAEKRQVAPNFITEVIDGDLRAGRHVRVVTRFPPEPNGYAHLGHAFASFLDFMTAQDYGGVCHLRLDDTNPEGESQEFADSLIRDMQWLGWDASRLFYASDYYERLYGYAEALIKKGLAYVESVSAEQMAARRGTIERPGTPSPYRGRSIAENLDLFRRMRAGEFENGQHALRAKIDLAHVNFKLRDPVLYRVLHATHYRTGNRWCIYPMYDFAHPLSDAIEGITHSMCSLEFIDNRAIYDWLMEHLFPEPETGRPPPRQYEFGRRSLEYTVVSKRKLRRLVKEGAVSGWDDPRMPTLSAQHRRGVTPEALRAFAAQVSVSRTNRTVDVAILENAIIDDLNVRAPRVMAVLNPLKVTLTNLADDRMLLVPYWPHDVVELSVDGLVSTPSGPRVAPEKAVRPVPLTSELVIERDDFSERPPPGFKRLVPGGTVRLRGAGIIRCDEVERGPDGEVSGLRAVLLDEEAKAKGVIHWVSLSQGVKAEARLFERLFSVRDPEGENPVVDPEKDDDTQPTAVDFFQFLNPHSRAVAQAYVEPSVQHDPPSTRYQFERQGYFWRDPVDSGPNRLVFNRIIALKDRWAKKTEAAPRPKADAREKPPAEAAARPVLTAEQEAAFERFTRQGLNENDARVLARDATLAAYLEGATPREWIQLTPWVVNDLSPALHSGTNQVTRAQLSALVAQVTAGTINVRIAKDALAQAQASGEAPAAIVERTGTRVLREESALREAVMAVLSAHPGKVHEYRRGRQGLMGFFTGQVMKATGGQADPKAVADLLGKVLS